jgi:hypothetical protein
MFVLLLVLVGMADYAFGSNPPYELLEICVQFGKVVSRHDRAEMSVRPYQNPVAGLNAVAVTNMSAVVKETRASAYRMDVKAATRFDVSKLFDFIPDQRPMWSFE